MKGDQSVKARQGGAILNGHYSLANRTRNLDVPLFVLESDVDLAGQLFDTLLVAAGVHARIKIVTDVGQTWHQRLPQSTGSRGRFGQSSG